MLQSGWKRRRPSIYDHVRAHVEPGRPGLTEGGESLPDENEAFSGGIRWAPGALEGAFSRYGGEPEDAASRAERLRNALVRLADAPGRGARRAALDLLREGADRTVMDDLLERLRTRPPENQQRLYDEMRRLVVESRNRDEVKFAIAVVGAFGESRDAELFRTLARHEEFTLYAAVALAAVVDDPVGEWLALLPDVSQWGLTELSELLLKTDDERVCPVLLRRGLAIGNALSLAVGCRLHEALDADDVDDELLEGARGILDDLTFGMSGPETLTDYPDAGAAVERFLELLAPRASTLEHFISACELRRFLEPPSMEEAERMAELFGGEPHETPEEEHLGELEQAGFDAVRVDHVRALCDDIVAREEWRLLAEAALGSDDDATRSLGIEAAKRLRLPLHDYLVEQIRSRPNDASLWFEFVWGEDAERIGEAVRLAEQVLDLEALASGPALELFGPGEEEGPHQAVDFILQELPRFPGVGWPLLRAALRSPVVRHRLVSLRALAKWPRELVDADITAAVRECLRDPDEDVRAGADAVLRGEPLPERQPDLDDE